MSRIIVGVMGPGLNPTKQDEQNAFEIGALCAQAGYVTLTGGSNKGVMHAALEGAKSCGGDTVGILAGGDRSQASDCADITIVTAMGSARNNINILSCHAIIACGMEAGTLSEVAMTLKAKKRVVLLTENEKAIAFLVELGKGSVLVARTAQEAVQKAKEIIETDTH